MSQFNSGTLNMRIFLAGVSCVGKTTVGKKLAALLGCPFFDLDHEIESFFSMPIEQFQNKFLTMYSFRQEAAKALKNLLKQEESENCVIALPPSGLMDNYWRVVKNAKGIIVLLTDEAENILERITFYDKDSQPIEKHLTEREKPLYLKEIKKDISYFKRSDKRADLSVNISGLNPEQAAKKVQEILSDHYPEEIEHLEYINRKGQTYYLHQGQTKTGKPKYFFSMNKKGVLLNTVPEGWEIYENPNAQVFLRKIKPKLITDEETDTVKKGIEQFCQLQSYLIDVKDNTITIYDADQDVEALTKILQPYSIVSSTKITDALNRSLSYSPIMKFILIEQTQRLFQTQRYCFRGSIDDWIDIGASGKLSDLVKKYVKHIGKDSYYDLLF
jgi:shikimate kinase